MKRSAMLLLAPLMVLLTGLLAGAPASAHTESPATSEAPVREAMNGFLEALNALDVDRMSAFFADDITAFVPTAKAERVNGKPAVVEVFRQFVETTRKTTARLQLVPEDLEVDAAGEIAIVTFNIRNAGTVMRRTFVFQYRGGRWLIVHFHASNFKLPV